MAVFAVTRVVDEHVGNLVPWYASGPRDIDRRSKRGVRAEGPLAEALANAYADDVCKAVGDKLRPHQRREHAPVLAGSIGLGMGASSDGVFVSVEAAMLYAIWSAQTTSPFALPIRDALVWRSGECMRVLGRGWIGVVSEHRLWTALAYKVNYRVQDMQTLRPFAAAWYPKCILDSIEEVLPTETVHAIIDLMLRLEGRGMPDLVFWTRGALRCYECKSSTDQLSWQQREAAISLRALPRVTCDVVYTDNAKHKEKVYDTD